MALFSATTPGYTISDTQLILSPEAENTATDVVDESMPENTCTFTVNVDNKDGFDPESLKKGTLIYSPDGGSTQIPITDKNRISVEGTDTNFTVTINLLTPAEWAASTLTYTLPVLGGFYTPQASSVCSGTGGVADPIELYKEFEKKLSFNVEWKDGGDTSHRPANNDFFVIQYSDNGGDWQPLTSAVPGYAADGNLWKYTFTDPASNSTRTYRVVPISVDGYIENYSEKNAITPVAPGEEIKPVVSYTKPEPDIRYFEIDWNDNHNEYGHRPAVDNIGGVAKVQYSDDNGANWAESADIMVEIEGDSANYWNCRVTDAWPKQGRQYRVASACPNGYIYSEPAPAENVTPIPEPNPLAPGDIPTVGFTALHDLEFYIDWKDISAKDSRPENLSPENLSLKRFFELFDLQCVTSASVPTGIGVENTGSQLWKITLKDLVAFDAKGLQNVYSVGLKDELRPKEPAPGQPAAGHYVTSISNTGNYLGQEKRIFNDGVLTVRIEDTVKFNFTKIWKDKYTEDTDKMENRPNQVTFRLYRYAEGAGSIADRSPVQGMDKMALPEEKRIVPSGKPSDITYTVGENSLLPRYDEEGREYVYYLTEKMSGNTDYKPCIGNTALNIPEGIPEGNEEKFVFNGGTITNMPVAETKTSATKVFKSMALQGMKAEVTFTLQCFSHDKNKFIDCLDENSEVKTKTVSGFTAETMGQKVEFGDLPKYDKSGLLNKYRIVESKVAIDGKAAESVPTPEDIRDGEDTYKVGEHEFRLSYEKDGSIVNRLIGETEIRIRKNWNPEPTEEASTEFTISCLNSRPGGKKEYVALKKENLDEKLQDPTDGYGTARLTEVMKDGGLRLTGTGNYEYVVSHLPLYDEDGYTIYYYADETSREIEVGGKKYKFSDLDYNTVDGPLEVLGAIPTATFYNTTEGGDILTFEITKKWLDDDDTLHRLPVQIGIYYTYPDAPAAEQNSDPDKASMAGTTVCLNKEDPAVLSVKNNWTDVVNCRAVDGDKEYDHYSVREIAMGSGGEYQAKYPAEYAPEAPGRVDTDQHIYKTWTEKEAGSENVYTVYNLRQGSLKITIEKNWNMGADLNNVGLKAKFRIKDDGEYINKENYSYYTAEGAPADDPDNLSSDSFIIDFKPDSEAISSTVKKEIHNLRKYDDNGRIINYEIAETALVLMDENGNQIGDPFDFEGGLCNLNVNGVNGAEYPVYSTVTRGDYIVGEKHTNDIMPWTFTNSISARGMIYVNKVWRDEGRDKSPRPDIVLKLYRTTDRARLGEQVGEFELKDAAKLWDTSDQWYWKCRFGEWPLYNSKGQRYFYYVMEDMHGDGYACSYYNNLSVLTPQPASGKNSPYEAFPYTATPVPGQKNAAAYAGVEEGSGNIGSIGRNNAGTIINTIVGKGTYKGIKRWLKLPGYFTDRSELPDVRVELYRNVNAEKVYDKDHYVATTDVNKQTGRFRFMVEVGESSGSGSSTPLDRLLDKYDEFGRPYYYYVKEVIAPKDPNQEIFETIYDQEYPENNIVNLYKGGEKGLEIKVSKLWKWSGADPERKPVAEFTLTQYVTEKDSESGTDLKPTGAEWVKTATPDGTEGENDEISFEYSGQNGVRFPYYSPDGKVYQYKITERMYYVDAEGKKIPITEGYEVKSKWGTDKITGDGVLIFSTDDISQHITGVEHTDGRNYNAKAQNTYVPGTNKLKFAKKWVDFDNKYVLRPEIYSSALEYNIVQYSQGETTGKPVDITGTWSMYIPDAADGAGADEAGTQNNNIWIYTVTGDETKLPKYDPWGRPYIYKVKEELGAPYKAAYTGSKYGKIDGVPYEGFTNTLKTVSIEAEKTWKAGGDKLTEQQVKDYFAFMGYVDSKVEPLPLKLNFELSWTGKNDTSLADKFDWLKSKENQGSSKLAGKITFADLTDLPQYYYNGDKAVAYEYKLAEKSITAGEGDSAVEVKSKAYTCTTDEPTGENRVFSFTNTLTDARPMRLVKVWDNDDVAEDIKYTVSRYTVSRDNTVKTYTIPKNSSKTNIKSLTVYLPKKDGNGETIKYSLTEEEGSWEQKKYGVVQWKDGESYKIARLIAGQYIPVGAASFGLVNKSYIDVTAQKVWINDGVDSEKFEELRPGKITLTLHRSLNGTEDKTFTNTKPLSNSDKSEDNSNIWETTWSELPVYPDRPHEDLTGSLENKYVYWVTEELAEPYDKIFSSEVKPDKDNAYSFTVTNTLKKMDLIIRKNWVGDEIWAADRPDIKVKLEYRVKNVPTSKWTEYKDYTLTADTTPKWQKTLSVPKYDKYGNELEYRLVEDGPYAGYTEIKDVPVLGNTHSVKNELKGFDIKVNKTWSGNYSTLYPEGSPASISYELQRKTADTDWEKVGNDRTVGTDGKFEYTFKNLPAYTGGNNGAERTEYQYRVVESCGTAGEGCPGYATAYDPSGSSSSEPCIYYGGKCIDSEKKKVVENITNTADPITITVTKKWDEPAFNTDGMDGTCWDIRPDDLEYTLSYRCGSMSKFEKVQLREGTEWPKWVKNPDDTWTVSFENLPRYSGSLDDRKPITYKFEEVVPTGYSVVYTGGVQTVEAAEVPAAPDAEARLELTNTRDSGKIKVQKKWAGEPEGNLKAAFVTPYYVHVKLQYSLDGTDWKNVEDSYYSNVILNRVTIESDDGGALEAENLPIYSRDSKGEIKQIKYRWMEFVPGTGGAADKVFEDGEVTEGLSSAYTVSYSPEWISAEKSDKELQTQTVTNTMRTCELTLKKIWQGDERQPELRPENLPIVLFYSTDNWVTYGNCLLTGDDWDKTGENEWTLSLKLPVVADDGRSFSYKFTEYPIGEAPYPYCCEKAESDAAAVEEGKKAELSITNIMPTVKLEKTKKWNDEGFSNYRPDKVHMLLQYSFDGGSTWTDSKFKDAVLSQENNKTSFVWDNLPKYLRNAADGNKIAEVVYRAVEVDASGNPVANGKLVPGSGYAAGWEESPGELNPAVTNSLETVKLQAHKVWKDEDNRYGLRPESLVLTVRYSDDSGKTWHDLVRDNKETVTDTLSGEGSSWDGREIVVPKYGPNGEDRLYRVTEDLSNSPYKLSTENFNKAEDGSWDCTLTNSLERTKLVIKKHWEDDSNYNELRPKDIKFVIESAPAASTAEKDWTPVTETENGNKKVMTVSLNSSNADKTGNLWQLTVENLPAENKDGKKLKYRAVETVPDYYEHKEENSVVSGDSSEYSLSEHWNTLPAVSISGKKLWKDFDNKQKIRPDNIELELWLETEDNKLVQLKQPGFKFEKPDKENYWIYSAGNLPRCIESNGAKLRVKAYIVRETKESAEGYVHEVSEVRVKPGKNSALKLPDLVNTLDCRLKIDNVTENAAHPGTTNAGGFVAVGSTVDSSSPRDVDGYKDNALSVSWLNEKTWLKVPQIVVEYTDHDSDTPFRYVIEDYSDISKLTGGRFPDARIKASGNRVTLTLADSVAKMPRETTVSVGFVPTLLVENTTAFNLGGTVAVAGGTYHYDRDGRASVRAAYGAAFKNWIADYTNIQIGRPGTLKKAYYNNGEGKYVLAGSDGRFTVNMELEIAGKMETVPVKGRVTLTAFNQYGQPTQVSVVLDELPASVDLGIPFLNPYFGPRTGDDSKLGWAIAGTAVGGGALIGLAVWAIVRRHKKRRKDD
ncbi:MAG: Cna B-type domain-containing protein [Candidatus Limivicinus sp.]